MRAAAVLLCVAALVLFADGASADVIDFDDISVGTTDDTQIADGYAGLTWDNFNVFDPDAYGYSGTGYNTGTVSEDNVAYNAFGEAAAFSDGEFTLGSAYFTAAWDDGLTIDVTGYSGGTLTWSTSLTVYTSGPTYVYFGWTGIDEVRFNSYDSFGSASHFVLDNLELNPVPEPATILLVATGAAGVLAARRRRQGKSIAS